MLLNEREIRDAIELALEAVNKVPDGVGSKAFEIVFNEAMRAVNGYPSVVGIVNFALRWNETYQVRAKPSKEDEDLHWAVEKLLQESKMPKYAGIA